MSQLISAWTPMIVKGEQFSKQFTFTDANGDPIAYTDFEIIVTPQGAAQFTWNVANGQVTFVSTGVYSLLVDDTETATYTWTEGKYKLSLTDPNSQPIPCLIENLIFARDC
jgi:hypothetical protein